MSSVKISQHNKEQLASYFGERSSFDPDEPIFAPDMMDSAIFQAKPTPKPGILSQMKNEKLSGTDPKQSSRRGFKETNPGYQTPFDAQNISIPIQEKKDHKQPRVWVRETNMPTIIPRS